MNSTQFELARGEQGLVGGGAVCRYATVLVLVLALASASVVGCVNSSNCFSRSRLSPTIPISRVFCLRQMRN